MPTSIWDKYQKIEEIKSESKIKTIKTYKAKIEPIIKEIIFQDKKEYYKIKRRIEIIKKKYKVLEIIEEKERFYIVINNKEELISEIDNLILKDELTIQEEGKIEGHGNPITKDEILNLFEMEESICRIDFETIVDNKHKSGHGSGFFCEISGNYPIKYALFTNNHILNESNLEIGKTIKFKYLEKSFFNSTYKTIEKKIQITGNRKTFTNQELDYTCIEIFESDGIKNFFKIEPNIYNIKSNSRIFEEIDIFVLQFPDSNNPTFSTGNIIQIQNNEILHHASTEEGSSGSPIIKRGKDNYIIGLHKASCKEGDKCLFNLGTTFDSILVNIKIQFNEINCIYIPDKDKKEIYLIHDYSCDTSKWNHEYNKESYLEAKKINKKLFEENIELYINDNKIKFNFKYKFTDSKEIKVKFVFKKILTNMSYMFYECSSLKSIDLSSFNSSQVNDMKGMFNNCSSLKSLNLKSFDTGNVNYMIAMFQDCSSLQSLDLSSFDTRKVIDMCYMFNNCSSLKSIDLSSFDTSNVINMGSMFQDCSSLQSLDLSSFNTGNVKDMSYMFNKCSSLKSLDLSGFQTDNVNSMKYLFGRCTSLKSLDLSSFITSKVNNMEFMFYKCFSLESLDLSKFDTNNVIDSYGNFYDCSSLRKENIKINRKEDKILYNFRID